MLQGLYVYSVKTPSKSFYYFEILLFDQPGRMGEQSKKRQARGLVGAPRLPELNCNVSIAAGGYGASHQLGSLPDKPELMNIPALDPLYLPSLPQLALPHGIVVSGFVAHASIFLLNAAA